MCKTTNNVCIFCDLENESKSVEHILSESFGNDFYVMPKRSVCDICNNRFSKFEQKAMANSVFVMERARYAIKTKKGKTAKGKVKGLEIEGSPSFTDQVVTMKGLSEENVGNFDPVKKTFTVTVQGFDKSEVATSKLVLKIALESIYKSRNKLFKKYDFSNLKDYLTTKTNQDWPFITASNEIGKFTSVPQYTTKYKLGKIHCEIKFLEKDDNTLLLKFRFGGITIFMNLLERSIQWAQEYLENEEYVEVYPKQFEKRLDLSKKYKKGKH